MVFLSKIMERLLDGSIGSAKLETEICIVVLERVSGHGERIQQSGRGIERLIRVKKRGCK
jgi:hypothetical protein